jgi:two-component system sensor histidine kinase/response regulator
VKRPSPPVKFLLVDDHDENLLALEALLRRDGLETLKAHSGDEALELLLAHDFALALLDVRMPGMDGFALAELMRGAERSKRIPIIFVTGAAEEQHRVFRGYDAGAVDFLVKPIDPRILRHKSQTFFDLFKQRQELEETLRLNETLMAVVGHDLRNPLHTIQMAAVLLEQQATQPSMLKIAGHLKSSSGRMSRIIDDLFDLARTRLGGGLPIDPTSVDLVAVVKRVVAEIQLANQARTIEMRHDPAVVGEWDESRIAQVVSNLVANAVRHGAREEPITISISATPAGARFCVHNGGVIAPSLLPHMFEPFRSGADARTRGEGLGLGLHIVEQIALAHGGSVSVVSTAEQGTTFQVELPLKIAPPPAPSTPP